MKVKMGRREGRVGRVGEGEKGEGRMRKGEGRMRRGGEGEKDMLKGRL